MNIQPRYELRPYQHSLVSESIAALEDIERVLLQAPTGAGKTVMFVAIAHHYLKQGCQVLVLVHRKELLEQAVSKFKAFLDVPVGLIKAGHNETPTALVQVASVQSLVKRKCPWLDPYLIITDECHHSISPTYQKIYERFPGADHLGVTATPLRLDGEGFHDIYSRLIQGPKVKALIDEGHLSRYRLFAPAKTINTRGIKTTTGDFNRKQLSRAAMSSVIMGAIFPTWCNYAYKKKTVGFCVDVNHSKAVTNLFKSAGITAAHLDGKIPPHERSRILQDFAGGNITYLSNCGIISEGFDVPGIEAVQILRPTASTSLYLQMLGRSLRPSPGKDQATIIDHTSNWVMHGLPCDEREWSLNGVEHQLKRLQRSSLTGEIQEWKPPQQDITAQMAEVAPRNEPRPEFKEASLDAIATAKEVGYKQGWVWYQVCELKPNFIELCWLAKALGYKQSWALHKDAELNPALPLPTKIIQPPPNLIPCCPQSQFSSEMEPDDRWIKVTDCITPPISRLLFRNQGRLVKFTGALAVVAMNPEQLMPLAEARLDKLSKAFQDVYGHEVHITLIADSEQISFAPLQT